MAEYIECRNCDSPYCDGCNIHSLSKMLHSGRFNCLINNSNSIDCSADIVSQAVFNQVKWERDTALATLEEYGIGFAQKVDVVKTVKCCDCMYKQENSDINNTSFLTCNLPWGLKGIIDPTDFCSYGKRRI